MAGNSRLSLIARYGIAAAWDTVPAFLRVRRPVKARKRRFPSGVYALSQFQLKMATASNH